MVNMNVDNIGLVELNTIFSFLTLDMIHDFHATLSRTSGWGQVDGPLDFRLLNGGKKRKYFKNKKKSKKKNNKKQYKENNNNKDKKFGKLEYELLLNMSPFLTKIFTQYSQKLQNKNKFTKKSKKTLKKQRSKVFEDPEDPYIKYGGMDRPQRTRQQPDVYRPAEVMHQALDPSVIRARRAARARMLDADDNYNWNPGMLNSEQRDMAQNAVSIINNMLTSLSEVWINLINNSIEDIFSFNISDCGDRNFNITNWPNTGDNMEKLEELLKIACSHVSPEEPLMDLFLDESWTLSDGEEVSINTSNYNQDTATWEDNECFASNGNQVRYLDRNNERCYLSQKLDSGCMQCNNINIGDGSNQAETMKNNVNILLKSNDINFLNIILNESATNPIDHTESVNLTGLHLLINNIEIKTEYYHLYNRKPTINSIVMIIYEYLVVKVNNYIMDKGIDLNLIDIDEGEILTVDHYKLLESMVDEENYVFQPEIDVHQGIEEQPDEIVRTLLGIFLCKAVGDLSIELEILLSGYDGDISDDCYYPNDENYDIDANNMTYITEDRLSFVRFCYLNAILNTCYNKNITKHAILSRIRRGNPEHIISPPINDLDGTECRRMEDGNCYTYEQVLQYYNYNEYNTEYYWRDALQNDYICDLSECNL